MIPSPAHTYELPLSHAFRIPNPLYRRFWDPVVLTTLPHLVAILFVAGCDVTARAATERIPFPFTNYAILIACSTCASVAWHLMHERKTIVFYIDYGLAGLWTMFDMYLGFTYGRVEDGLAIVLLNLFVLFLNKFTDRAANYALAHSFWHLCSVAKAVLVAYLVGCKWKTQCLAGH